MGTYIEEKVAMLTEAAKVNFIGEAVAHLKGDVEALNQKANDLDAQASEARNKAAAMQAEINEIENPSPAEQQG